MQVNMLLFMCCKMLHGACIECPVQYTSATQLILYVVSLCIYVHLWTWLLFRHHCSDKV